MPGAHLAARVLDWLCLPRFDSPAVFAALLDADKGGRFAIHPVVPGQVRRSYLEDTNVLETIFTTGQGEVSITDFMPVGHPKDYRRKLWPERYLLRLVEGRAGEVEMEALYEPRPQYGKYAACLTNRGGLGLHYEHRGQALILGSDFPLALRPDRSAASGRMTVRRGEMCAFSLSFTEGNVAIIPPLCREYLAEQLVMTVDWWRQWAACCTYRGPYRRQVVRSLLALKLLTYAPSGAVVAAPTSSLPERIGGSRNWDYRYCWLRDAAMTIRAFLHLGYSWEAESFLSWLLHTTSLSKPELQVLYSLYGETRLRERELSHLSGYRASRPVRVGNAASEQLQLDVLLTILLEGSRALGFSRMSFTFMLGTVFTANRDHAEWIGLSCHFVMGWLFALFYGLIFAAIHYRSWWLGMVIGLLHALFLNLAVLPLLPYIHPRMGNEYHGPTPTRMLEPPGILGLNHGRRTPETSFAAHLLFGLILGSLLGGMS